MQNIFSVFFGNQNTSIYCDVYFDSFKKMLTKGKV